MTYGKLSRETRCSWPKIDKSEGDLRSEWDGGRLMKNNNRKISSWKEIVFRNKSIKFHDGLDTDLKKGFVVVLFLPIVQIRI